MEHILEKSIFKAENLQLKKPFQNLYELDLSMWMFFRSCATYNENITADHLQIPAETARLLSNAPDSKLRIIASGVLLSFSINSSTNEFLSSIRRSLVEYDLLLPELLSPNCNTNHKLEVLKAERYLRVMRDLALYSGAKRAALAFNVDYEVAQAVLELSDSQLLHLALNSSISFKLRFNEKTLRELLTRENTTHYSLVRYQQALSDDSKSVLPKGLDTLPVNSSTPLHPQLEDQPTSSSFKSHSPLWVKAKHLTVMGFITRAVTVETGISQKQMVRLKKEILDDGIELPAIATKLRSGGLVRDYISSIQASLLMLAYYRYGGSEISTSIDIDALSSALMLFYKIRHEAKMNPHRWKPIDSNAGYSLARELRGNGKEAQAYFEYCSSCDLKIFISTNQLVNHDERCPFCRIKDAKKIKAA